MYNNFVLVAEEPTVLEYLIGSGPMSIPYPPEDSFKATWLACGNVTASLIDYNESLATLYDTEIVIQTDDVEMIG